MAFGAVKGTLVGSNASIPNPFVATGSVAVAVGDLIVVLVTERVSLTAGTVTDNLGHTYTAQNAGTDGGNATGKAYWKIATAAGTLTSVSAATTPSTDDAGIGAVVYEGAFNASPLDASPANVASATAPFTGPATGVLAQADELVVNWWAGTPGVAAPTSSVGTVNVIPGTTGANSQNGAIASLVVSATTSTQATWTASGAASAIEGVMTFKKAAGGAATSLLRAPPSFLHMLIR